MGETTATGLRAFIAIELPACVRDALAAAQAPLRRLPVRVSWVRSENLHLTLIFLGDISPARVVTVGRILDPICADTPGFSLSVSGVGTFGSPRYPRVVWAGVPAPPTRLMTLHHALRDRLRAVGFEVDRKAFRPHVTLGRIRARDGVGQLTSAIASANNTDFGEVPVRRVVLVQSQVDTRGPRYTIIRESGLKGS